VEDIHALHAKYAHVTDIVTVYIVEAHAMDEWPVGDPLKITQPLSTAERCGLARSFTKSYELKVPMLVDCIDNNFSTDWAAWPVRFFVVQDKKLIFKAQPDHKNTYDSIPVQLDTFLSKLTSTLNR